MRKQSALYSFCIHMAAIAVAALVTSLSGYSNRKLYEVVSLEPMKSVPMYSPRLKTSTPDSGAPGGGNRDPLPPTRGAVPRVAKPFVLTPRTVDHPQIALPNGLEDMPQISLNIPVGVPNGVTGVVSAGPGRDKGTGNNGCCGKVGDGPGGNGKDGLRGDGGFQKLSAHPQLLWKIEPEYSEDARKARFQGSVLLALEVDADGRPRRIRVIRALGMGLDERAVEAVSRWKFKPGLFNGRAVSAPVTVEVSFRLL